MVTPSPWQEITPIHPIQRNDVLPSAIVNMARSSEAEISGHLAENIEKWRKLGISHGLEDREIDECILRTLPEHKMGRDTLGNHATKGNFEWSLRKICFTSWIVLISLLTLLCVLSTVHPPTERLIGKLTAPYTYSVMRLVRLLSLPLNRNFDLSGNRGT